MPQEEPVMPDQETTAPQTPVQATAYEEHEQWLDEPDELPARPRRRLLTPVPLALLGVLLIACGFIGGVLVEKGQTSTSSSAGSGAAGLVSRFGGSRGAAGAGTSGAATSGSATAGAAAGGLFGRSGGGGAGATVGQVAYSSGATLYVTTAEGNTVKVTTSAASTVTKTVKADVKGIHPGETVIVTGAADTNGTISAESIRVSEAGAGGGGLAGLFGGGSGRRGAGAAGAKGGGGEPTLFGG